MGTAVTLIAEHPPREEPSLSPVGPAYAKFGRRLLRRDVGGAIRIPGAGDRRLEGERDGSRSRRPAVTVSEQSASNGAEPVTAERHRAVRAWVCPTLTGPHLAEGRSLQRDTNRRTQGVERQPLGREALEPCRGLPRRLHRGPPGAARPPRGCRVGTRVPVAPRAPPRGTDGACAKRSLAKGTS